MANPANHPLAGITQTLTFPASGMTCAACVHHVTQALRAVGGVSAVSVNLATERAAISLTPTTADTATAYLCSEYQPPTQNRYARRQK